MRQYGFPEGNGWDTERPFRAAKARAVENRIARDAIAEQLEDFETAETGRNPQRARLA